MDLRPTPRQLALRQEIQAWLAANLEPRVEGREWQRRLAAGGWGAPAWPVEYGGRGLGPLETAIVDEELTRSGAPQRIARIGTGWAAPAIIAHGDDAQKRRFLPSILSGEQIWCQLFSEPGAGSDLAGLRTRAELRGDHWIVSGQKTWTSYAREADYGILLARTDPDSQRQAGITFFAFPMRQAGVEIRPIKQMDGHASFNEVFFTDAQIPAGHVIGQVGDGWKVAITTLLNERTSLSTGAGALWGAGPSLEDLVALARRVHADRLQRQKLAALKIEAEAIRLTAWRMLSTNPLAASMSKVAADQWGQRVTELAMEMLGMSGVVENPWADAFLFSPALTIGGGTTEVQKSILAQRALGLPRDR